MLAFVFSGSGTEEVEATPRCGVDHCEQCGDCLACYAEYGCWLYGADAPTRHSWVIYPEQAEAFLAYCRDSTPEA